MLAVARDAAHGNLDLDGLVYGGQERHAVLVGALLVDELPRRDQPFDGTGHDDRLGRPIRFGQRQAAHHVNLRRAVVGREFQLGMDALEEVVRAMGGDGASRDADLGCGGCGHCRPGAAVIASR